MPLVLLKNVRSDEFSIDENNLENFLVKPTRMELAILFGLQYYNITLDLKKDEKRIHIIDICKYWYENEANEMYDKISECIKRGNYKLIKTEINFGCPDLEREIGRREILFYVKQPKGEIPEAIIIDKNDK